MLLFYHGNNKDCIAKVEPRASLYEPEEDCKKIKTTLLVLSKISTEAKDKKCENLTHKEAEWACRTQVPSHLIRLGV